MREIALVTGASRGIGKAIALELAKDGYDIWLNYNSNDEQAKKVQSEIESLGRKCQLMKFDVSSKDSIRNQLVPALEKLNKEEEIVTALVNNAGIIRDNIFYWMKDSEWEDVIQTNLNSFFYVTKCLVEHMILNKKGSIVNISSVSGLIGNYAQANYSAAKAGIIAATKTLAKELGRSDIRVNAVVPGIILTDMVEQIKDNKEMKKMIPLRRFGKPEEVAYMVSFLCSAKAQYVTGAVMPVTGGLFN